MCDFDVFFLMIRRPPRSTLFPTRRSSDLAYILCKTSHITLKHQLYASAIVPFLMNHCAYLNISTIKYRTSITKRSEEHTSELQSRQYLVCRLLLEKKKP